MKKVENTRINGILKNSIIIIIVVSIVAVIGFAYARYVTKLNGATTADIAKWSFKVNGSTNQNFVIDLADTRTGLEQEAEVQESYIGPGTAGAFEIELDATGSDVSLEYDINLNVDYSNNEVFPKNLIFYTDSTMQNAIYHTDNNINLNGFIGWNDGSKVHTKTIYWKWDYETGSTQTEKDNNDIADSYWMGKTITLSMNVTAKQVNENPTAGQYAVTFDANGGTLQGYGNSGTATKQVTNGENYGDLPKAYMTGYKFDGWCGKNLLKLSGRTVQSPGGGYSPCARTFSGNGIYVGIAGSNHYNTQAVRKYNIDENNNSILVNNSVTGYGVGFDVKVTPNTQYCIKFSGTADVYISEFDGEGNVINYSYMGSSRYKNIYTSINTQWLLITVSEGDKNNLNKDVEALNIQLEKGNTPTNFEPYKKVTSDDIVNITDNQTLTAIWKKE